MKKIVVSLSILLLAVAVLVTSLAWYASNEQLKAQETTITAGEDVSIKVVYQRVDLGNYNGENGTGTVGDADAPYKVAFNIAMENQTLSQVCHMVVAMDRLIITRGKPDVPPYLTDTTDVAQEFTWRFVYDGKQYKPDALGRAVSVEDGTPFLVPNGRIQLVFTLIYLSENRYTQWQTDCERSKSEYDALITTDPTIGTYLEWVKGQTSYFNYPEFLYSHASNMNTTFYFDFKFSIVVAGGDDSGTP